MASNSVTNDSEPITNPHARVAPTPENPRGYPPFDIRLVPNYTNNQITYHYITGAIPAAEQARFQQLMKQRKTSLDLLGWDSMSDENNQLTETLEDSHIPKNSNSDYSIILPGYREIKINPLNISKFTYNNMVAQYNN